MDVLEEDHFSIGELELELGAWERTWSMMISMSCPEPTVCVSVCAC